MENLLTIQQAQAAPPCTVVIFGASGDLAKRKLIPSLYNLEACGEGMMPAKSAVLEQSAKVASVPVTSQRPRDCTLIHFRTRSAGSDASRLDSDGFSESRASRVLGSNQP